MAAGDTFVLSWPAWGRSPAYAAVFAAIPLFGRSRALDFVYFQH